MPQDMKWVFPNPHLLYISTSIWVLCTQNLLFSCFLQVFAKFLSKKLQKVHNVVTMGDYINNKIFFSNKLNPSVWYEIPNLQWFKCWLIHKCWTTQKPSKHTFSDDISTSIWSEQYPNTYQNKQHLPSQQSFLLQIFFQAHYFHCIFSVT